MRKYVKGTALLIAVCMIFSFWAVTAYAGGGSGGGKDGSGEPKDGGRPERPIELPPTPEPTPEPTPAPTPTPTPEPTPTPTPPPAETPGTTTTPTPPPAATPRPTPPPAETSPEEENADDSEALVPMPADDLSDETIAAALASEVPVIIVLSEDASTIISEDVLQLIRNSETVIYIELPSGIVIRIDPASITDDAVCIDLNVDIEITRTGAIIEDIDYQFSANAIAINPSAQGEFGIDLQIHITADMLRVARLNADNLQLYHISYYGDVTDATDNIMLIDDGSVTIDIAYASQWVLTEVDLVAAAIEADEPPPEEPEAYIQVLTLEPPAVPIDMPLTIAADDGGNNILMWVLIGVGGAAVIGAAVFFIIRKRKVAESV